MLTHYQALNVSFSADLAAIKKAYHKISLSCHPDKTVHLSAKERAEREHLFKVANVAFEVLSDPQKRRLYNQSLGVSQDGHNTQNNDATPCQSDDRAPKDAWSRSGQQSRSPSRHDREPSPPLHSSTHLHRAPESTYRFSVNIQGVSPDFQWYHCQLNERDQRGYLNYSNWLGWRFSVEIAQNFRVVGKPIIPEKPVQNTITVRLPLQRRPGSGSTKLYDIVLDLMGTPGSKHAVLSSALIETKQSLELLIELVIASNALQKSVCGPTSYKWAYKIDHDALVFALSVKVTSVMFYPFKPQIALSPTGELPAPPYPDGSPMRGLQNMFPDIHIENLAPELYCRQEEQRGVRLWRLLAVGFK